MKNIIKKRVLKIVATIVFAGLGSQHAISQDLDLEKDELKFDLYWYFFLIYFAVVTSKIFLDL